MHVQVFTPCPPPPPSPTAALSTAPLPAAKKIAVFCLHQLQFIGRGCCMDSVRDVFKPWDQISLPALCSGRAYAPGDAPAGYGFRAQGATPLTTRTSRCFEKY
eukprot:1153088-Pelagomonas_calceolata.AAC.3